MGEIPAPQSPMDKIGDLPDGRTLYYAGDRFAEPGFYIGDPDGDPVNQRVELIPARGTPAGEARPVTTGSKFAAEHLAEAIKIHAHAVELGREVEDSGDLNTQQRAMLHFEVARSAAAVAGAAYLGEIVGELETGLHNLGHAVGVASGT